MLAPHSLPSAIAETDAAEVLRAANFIVRPGVHDDFGVPANTLCGWLRDFDAWFKATTGIMAGRNLHLLYGRAVRLSGEDVLMRLCAVNTVASVAKELGLSFSAGLPFTACRRERSALSTLLPHLNGGLTLVADAGAEHCPPAEALALVEAVLAHCTVILVGPTELFNRWGVLDSPVCNAVGFTLAPRARLPAADLHRVRRGWHLPCQLRMGLYVDPEGDLYPCRGLLGERQYALGSVFQPVSESFLGGAREYALAFLELAARGPFATGIPDSVLRLRRASVCDAHRYALGLPVVA